MPRLKIQNTEEDLPKDDSLDLQRNLMKLAHEQREREKEAKL